LNPVGVYGELCVGGTGVSRGYMNKPEITHEKFTMAPFDPGKRIYLTGDLARWLPDGTIQFLGRTDYQVKIRGYRIEPGEIENRLLKHEKIKEAFVIPRTENSNNYLCAYIISCESLKTEDLRNYLLSYLPEYMIPSYFVTLEKFPITPNGKIDREALPAPDINAAHEYVAPTDNLEKKLVAIWADILMLDQEIIGIDTSFFELGGHSLKTTLLVSRIHKEFRVKLPMTEVFRNPKIRYMAEYIRNSTMDIYTTIEPIEKKTYYPLSSAQKRLYILQQMNVESVAYNIRDLVMLEEKPKLEKLEEAFRQLIQRHESLRTSFEMINGETYQRIHADVRLAVQYFDLTMLESGLLETSEEKMIQDFEKSFDLSQAPLIRVGLIKSDNFRYILVVDMHHIISDGISREILIEDFKALYADKKLPELKLHYKDYSEWQNSSLMRENLAKQENYWLSLFNPPLPRLNLPTDYPRTKIMSFEGNFAHFMTEKEETAQLNKIVRSENATMFIVILAIYNIFLAKISNQEDIIVGVPIAGRNHADLEKVIGMFVNTLALRNQPTGQRTFLEFLREVKKNTLQAFDNQDYLFEQLVEKVDDRCDLNRNPIFDVIFSFYSEENANRKTTPTTESIDLKIKPYPLKSTSSKFDLSLSASENGEILHFTFSYKLKLFKKEKIELFSQYFRRILSQISKNPNIEIRSIEIIDKSQKDNLMADVYDDLENE
jgi:acyl carrier protein